MRHIFLKILSLQVSKIPCYIFCKFYLQSFPSKIHAANFLKTIKLKKFENITFNVFVADLKRSFQDLDLLMFEADLVESLAAPLFGGAAAELLEGPRMARKILNGALTAFESGGGRALLDVVKRVGRTAARSTAPLSLIAGSSMACMESRGSRSWRRNCWTPCRRMRPTPSIPPLPSALMPAVRQPARLWRSSVRRQFRARPQPARVSSRAWP